MHPTGIGPSACASSMKDENRAVRYFGLNDVLSKLHRFAKLNEAHNYSFQSKRYITLECV